MANKRANSTKPKPVLTNLLSIISSTKSQIIAIARKTHDIISTALPDPRPSVCITNAERSPNTRSRAIFDARLGPLS